MALDRLLVAETFAESIMPLVWPNGNGLKKSALPAFFAVYCSQGFQAM
jgi:hypothetical protein